MLYAPVNRRNEMSRYCSDAIAIAHLAGPIDWIDRNDPVGWAMRILDAAECRLRHNSEHIEVPKDEADEAFDVPKLTDGPKS